jgi:Ni/Fe-hydrogenase subunit HybB-like protein
MTRWGRQCAIGFGTLTAWLAQAAIVMGIVALLAGFALHHQSAVMGALAAAWLLFAGMSAGGVALAAGIRIAQGRWARQVLPTAEASIGFFIPALGILVLLTLGASLWIPWAAHGRVREWVSPAARDLLSTCVLFALGYRFVRGDRAGNQSIALAVAYSLVYAITLSLWAVDLVMSPHTPAPTTALPAYYFVGAFVSALAWIALVSCVQKEPRLDSDGRHDVGKLLFGFITFLAYLLWSIFLPTWYGNLPEETGLLLARWQGAYRPFALCVIVVTFIFPFILLLTEKAKRHRGALALGAASVLLGLGVERFLFVFPSLEMTGGWIPGILSAGTAAGVGGLFMLTFGAALPVSRGEVR